MKTQSGLGLGPLFDLVGTGPLTVLLFTGSTDPPWRLAPMVKEIKILHFNINFLCFYSKRME